MGCQMDLRPVKRQVPTIIGYTARWRIGQRRAQMQVSASGIKVEIKGGNAELGFPGDIVTYAYSTQSLEGALSVAIRLCDRPSEKDLVKAGFERTGFAILD